MKIYVVKRYNKRSGGKPIESRYEQPRGVGSDIHAEIRLDPSLKKHPDLRRALIRDEKNKIREWGRGNAFKKAKTPRLLRDIGGVKNVRDEIKRRES